MTIYKTTKTPTGVEVSHHVVHKLETTENFLEVKIGLRGYTSESDSQDPARAISWYWEVFVPASAVTDISSSALEVLLTSNQTSPFYGGVLLDLLTPLETARKVKWAQIKAARASSEYAGFMFKGHLFDSDSYSQGNIQGAVLQAILEDEAFTREWTLADNTTMVLTKADVIEMGMALGAHIDSVHSRGRALRALIEAPDATVEYVEAITWDSATYNPPQP